MYNKRIFIITFIASLLSSLVSSSSSSSPFSQGKDELTKTECSPLPEENNFILECPEDMRLAIREAYFSTSLEHNHNCPASNSLHRSGLAKTCYEDLRLQVNSRCSAAKRCNFTDSDVMNQCSAPGHIYLTYSCISTNLLEHYCNAVLERPYGYISSPTYPDYSTAVDECNWTIRGQEGQWIELEVLDTQITAPRVVRPKTFLQPAVLECTDSLKISEEQKLVTLCGDDVKNLQTFSTKGPEVKLSYGQNEFRATRGWLVRYQIIGCLKLKDPFKGHIIEQNETSALITCCEGFVFKDTRESIKTLSCLKNKWNGIVSSCIALEELNTIPEIPEASVDFRFENPTNPPMEHHQSEPIQESPKAFFSDFIIPISLMVLLAVVLVIFAAIMIKCRQKREKARLLTYTHEASVPLTNQSPVNV